MAALPIVHEAAEAPLIKPQGVEAIKEIKLPAHKPESLSQSRKAVVATSAPRRQALLKAARQKHR
jgi:hypothetical protein